MKSVTALFIITVGFASTALTVPAATTPTVVGKKPFAETCTNIGLLWYDKWVIADCLIGNGKERLTSAVFLDNKIKDNDGYDISTINLKVSNATFL